MDELEAKRLISKADRARRFMESKQIQEIFKELEAEVFTEFAKADVDAERLMELKLRHVGFAKTRKILEKWINDGKRAEHALREIREAVEGRG